MAKGSNRRLSVILLAALAIGAVGDSRALAVCRGDCSGNGGVSPEELGRIISIVNLCDGNPAGCAAVPGTDKQCASADVDASGKITAGDVSEIIATEVIESNPDCEAAGLGTRIFTIKQSAGLGNALATGFFSSGNNGLEVTDDNSWFVTQPLKLRAGNPDPSTGIASLRLEEDAIFGGQVFKAQNGPTLCIKVFAQGSSGQVDCDGGSKQDVLFQVDSHGGPCQPPGPCAASAPVVTPFSNAGAAARAGGATLAVMATVDNISPALASAANCATHTFGEPSLFYFTTERATAEVSNVASNTAIRSCSLDPNTTCSPQLDGCPAAGKGVCTTTTRLSRLGVAFTCAAWTTTDGPGRFVTPLFGEDTAVGDTGNILLIGDN